MKKVFITGVAGFVGSNLAGALLSKGYAVSGLDDLSQGSPRHLETLSKHSNFEFHKGDVCDAQKVDDLVRGKDVIAHLAAFKIPRYGGASKTLTVNTKGTENVLEAAKKYKCRVLFSSTSDIYGKNPEIPFHEESNSILGPTKVGRWAYAVSKIYDEHLCLAYHHEFKIPVSIVRYFGGYGPHQHLSWRGGPQSVFIEHALNHKTIPIHGDGQQTRSFTFVEDMVRGTISAMEKEAAIGEVFNIGSNEEINILNLAKKIWKLVRQDDPKIEFIPYKNFARNYEDVHRRVPDMKKSKELLGFAAQVSLDDGLKRTIEWQKSLPQA